MKTQAKPQKPNTKDTSKKLSEELKTDFPISEKDEIKAAEVKLKELQKKNGR